MMFKNLHRRVVLLQFVSVIVKIGEFPNHVLLMLSNINRKSHRKTHKTVELMENLQ